MIGTDYSHADQSAEIQAVDVIEQRAEKEKILALRCPQAPGR
jgi:hypothetical protein